MEALQISNTEEQNCASPAPKLVAEPAYVSASLAASVSVSKQVTFCTSRLNSLKDCASQTELDLDVDSSQNRDVEQSSNAPQIDSNPNAKQKDIASKIDSNQNQNNNDRSRSGIRDQCTGERRFGSQGRCQEQSEKEVEEKDFAFGPRVRGRRRPMASAISTMSTPPPAAEEQSTLPFGRDASTARGGRDTSTARGVSPRRSDNGLIDFAYFSDSYDSTNRDGSAHRSGSLFLPSATWTPPSLRHFGFPTEFKGFFEVAMLQFISPWTDKIWKVVKEDYQRLPDNWKEVPATRRIVYAVIGFASGYYLLISLYAIPLVTLGFLAPAYLCRQYLEHEGDDEENHLVNNNNNDVNQALNSVKEMSLWMKFWVSFCGWLMVSSLAPRIIAAVLPLKILTLLFVVASVVAPWSSNPSVLCYDRLLLPLFHRIDGFVESYKEKIIDAVSNSNNNAGNNRRRD